jgi:hypothetical protein
VCVSSPQHLSKALRGASLNRDNHVVSLKYLSRGLQVIFIISVSVLVVLLRYYKYVSSKLLDEDFLTYLVGEYVKLAMEHSVAGERAADWTTLSSRETSLEDKQAELVHRLVGERLGFMEKPYQIYNRPPSSNIAWVTLSSRYNLVLLRLFASPRRAVGRNLARIGISFSKNVFQSGPPSRYCATCGSVGLADNEIGPSTSGSGAFLRACGFLGPLPLCSCFY